MASRHGMAGPGLRSDCAPVASLVEALLGSGADVHAMHDPTRGGAAVTCNEVAGRAGVRIVLDEARLPVSGEVAAIAELLGLDPLYLASEGRVLAWVASAGADRALEALRAHPLGKGAARIGAVEPAAAGSVPVLLRTRIGGERPVDLLSGMDLPRIC
jgi:hydrogenase expression/formation protein HypE